jgi:hypothetical protein
MTLLALTVPQAFTLCIAGLCVITTTLAIVLQKNKK